MRWSFLRTLLCTRRLTSEWQMGDGREEELGAWHSALRTVRAVPDGARVASTEFNPANAEIARAVLDHAGVGDRVTVVVGTLADDARTIAALESKLLRAGMPCVLW